MTDTPHTPQVGDRYLIEVEVTGNQRNRFHQVMIVYGGAGYYDIAECDLAAGKRLPHQITVGDRVKHAAGPIYRVLVIDGDRAGAKREGSDDEPWYSWPLLSELTIVSEDET